MELNTKYMMKDIIGKSVMTDWWNIKLSYFKLVHARYIIWNIFMFNLSGFGEFLGFSYRSYVSPNAQYITEYRKQFIKHLLQTQI